MPRVASVYMSFMRACWIPIPSCPVSTCLSDGCAGAEWNLEPWFSVILAAAEYDWLRGCSTASPNFSSQLVYYCRETRYNLRLSFFHIYYYSCPSGSIIQQYKVTYSTEAKLITDSSAAVRFTGHVGRNVNVVFSFLKQGNGTRPAKSVVR